MRGSVKTAGMAALVGLGLMGLTGEAFAARLCRQVSCAKRAPFVCSGPPGSCGFAQGKCLQTSIRLVPCGGPFVGPR